MLIGGKLKLGNYKAKKPSEQTTMQQGFMLLLHDIIYLLAAVVVVLLLLFRVVVVSGSSMYNTLVDGDYLLLVSNTIYQNPKQGDIIVASKESFRGGEPIIKRVIATEGQIVDIDFKSGIVYVDGEALDEPYTYTPTTREGGTHFPLEVEEGSVFVMGDNRDDSRDSRYPEIGLIDCREILGKAIFLFIPGTNEGMESADFGRIGVLS